MLPIFDCHYVIALICLNSEAHLIAMQVLILMLFSIVHCSDKNVACNWPKYVALRWLLEEVSWC